MISACVSCCAIARQQSGSRPHCGKAPKRTAKTAACSAVPVGCNGTSAGPCQNHSSPYGVQLADKHLDCQWWLELWLERTVRMLIGGSWAATQMAVVVACATMALVDCAEATRGNGFFGPLRGQGAEIW